MSPQFYLNKEPSTVFDTFVLLAPIASSSGQAFWVLPFFSAQVVLIQKGRQQDPDGRNPKIIEFIV